MAALDKKIDFAVVISVHHANPNGDPLNENIPRIDINNIGEISDVCLKRKIRNRLMHEGESIFVQSDDNKVDNYKSLSDRFESEIKDKDVKNNRDKLKNAVCEKWFDVRAFGQVFAFSKGNVSLGIRGPVSIMPAFSVDPVIPTEIQITKSVNSEVKKAINNDGSEGADKKSSDTMGRKSRIDFGVYVTYGSINCEIASKTGFSKEDALKVKEALRTLFRNDASSARPEGSMEVVKLVWWEHNCANGNYSSAKVHNTFKLEKREGVDEPKTIDDYVFKLEKLDNLLVEEICGE